MKILLVIVLFTISSISFAYEYTDNDRDMFYDAFIEGYVKEMTNAINSLNIDENKKAKCINEFINHISRTELIDSSWMCIKNYPINEIVTASVICTQDWNKKQTQKFKEIYAEIK